MVCCVSPTKISAECRSLLGSSTAVAEITTSDVSASERSTAVDQGRHTCSKLPVPALVKVLL